MWRIREDGAASQNGRRFCLGALLLLASSSALADTAAFDLIGTQIEMHVTRASTTLPISEVSNLQAGDRMHRRPAGIAGSALA